MLRIVLALVLANPAQVTEASVRTAFEESISAVRDALGKALEPLPPLSFTTASELGRRVARENLAQIMLRQADTEKGAQEADRQGEAFARFAYAKYSWSAKEFLVVLESWNEKARMLGAADLTEDETVRAVLVHEIVHALDDAAYDLAACLLRCPTVDAVTGFSAVLEGHAQHVARAVCARAGWSDGFEAFSAHIGALPSGVDEVTLQLLRALSATTTSAYRDGERFVAALEASGGAELVARAFQAPPDAETIFHPDWFLDPTSRPVARYDPEPVLDLFNARFSAETWNATRASITPAQVSAALAFLPEETVRKITATLRSARALTLQPVADPTAKFVSLLVLEFDAPASAEAYLGVARELSHVKDERMKRGVNRILSSSYATLDCEDFKGELFQKRMKSGRMEFDALSIDLQRGPLLLETVFSNEPIEREEHVALVRRLLDTVRAR